MQARNRGPRDRTLVIEDRGWANDALTAHEVTTMQAFRDLFADAVLRPGDEVEIRRVALMFTDIKGSSALYNRVGDALAYGWVREHFAVLAGAVRRHDGAVVKTIGEPVDDSGPVLVPAGGPAREPMDERPRRVAGAWMHHDARRLVDDEQVLVLVGDAELDVLGLDLPRRLRWELDLKLLAALEAVALRARSAVHAHVAALDEPFGRGARADFGQLGEITVEPRARCFRWNPKRRRREPGAAARVGAAGGAARRAGRARRGR